MRIRRNMLVLLALTGMVSLSRTLALSDDSLDQMVARAESAAAEGSSRPIYSDRPRAGGDGGQAIPGRQCRGWK